MKYILITIATMLAVVVLGALAYALIIINHERRWRKIKSDRYEQHNQEN